MFNYLIVFLAGLIVGWNVLPQPAWVRNGYQLVVAKIKDLFAKNS